MKKNKKTALLGTALIKYGVYMAVEQRARKEAWDEINKAHFTTYEEAVAEINWPSTHAPVPYLMTFIDYGAILSSTIQESKRKARAFVGGFAGRFILV